MQSTLAKTQVLHFRFETAVIVSHVDASKEFSLQRRLRMQDVQLREAQRALNFGCWRYDVADDCWTCSSKVFEILGLDPNEVGDNLDVFLALVHPDDKYLVLDGLNRAMAEHGPLDIEYRIRRPDGEQRIIHGCGELDSENVDLGPRYIGVIMDVSKLRESERNLQISEQRYRALFTQNPDAVYAIDLAGRYQGVNSAFVKLCGYCETEICDLDYRVLVAPEDIDRNLKNFKIAASGETVNYELRCLRKDGTRLDVDVTNMPIVVDDRVVGLYGIARDITERKQHNREMARINRALRLLSACSESLIRIDNETELLQEICRIAVVIGGYQTAWVGYIDDGDPSKARPIAGAKASRSSGRTVASSPDRLFNLPGKIEESPIASDEIIEVDSMTQNVADNPWLADVLERGHPTEMRLPLEDEQGSFGVLILYSDEELQVGSDELTLLKRLADNLAYGIVNIRSRNERLGLYSAVVNIAAVVEAYTGETFFRVLVEQMVETMAGCAGFIVTFEEDRHAHTIFSLVEQQRHSGETFLISGTPYEETLLFGSYVVNDGVAEKYPSYVSGIGVPLRALVIQRLNDADGQPVGALLVGFRDSLRQTEFATSLLKIYAARAAAELIRQRNDAKMRDQAALLDQTHDAVIVTDLDQHILYSNKATEELYGWSKVEALGKRLADLILENPLDLDSAVAEIERCGQWVGRQRHRRRDGGVITVQGTCTLVPGKQRRPPYIISTYADISQFMKMEIQLQQSQRLEALGQLTGGIAHDFNNLLTVILGNTEALVDKLYDQPRLRALADLSRTAAQRGATLTHRLLTFARRQKLEPSAIDIGMLLRGMHELLGRTLGENIDISVRINPHIGLARVDSVQLESAILNLCINARDAMPEGGDLTIEAANVEIDSDYNIINPDAFVGEYVMVAISDTGHGIPPEYLDRIFDPFFTTKEFGKGTGLGLSMVYGFIKQSSGHIKIYSEQGSGTTIRMYIPRADRTDVVSSEPKEDSILLTGDECILLVEDDTLVREYADGLLQSLGYRVIAARNGSQALEILGGDNQIDLLFTDIVMPGGINGRELSEAALKLRPELKILFTSGYTENAALHQGYLDPGFHLLSKPYRRVQLAAKVRATLDGAAP